MFSHSIVNMKCRKYYWILKCLLLLTLVTNLLASSTEEIQPRSLQSLVSSSEVLQKLLHSRGFLAAEASLMDPSELNRMLAKFKPKQGKFDPVMMDMLSNFNNLRVPGFYPTESQESPSPIIAKRLPSSTEENELIWSSTKQSEEDQSPPPIKHKFSARFRNHSSSPLETEHGFKPSNFTLTTTASPEIPRKPFNHITDPNIRNHRLYDWEFENYKNFTHIDQAEDLMADESEPTANVVEFQASPEDPSNWTPNPQPTRPVSMEGASLNSAGDLVNDVSAIPSDSEDDSNGSYRPRAPLQESSTENLIFSHISPENKYPDLHNYANRFRSEEVNESKFRPSDAVLTPPVFVEPDQDFFTSTIKSDDKYEDFGQPPHFRPSQKGKYHDRILLRNRDRMNSHEDFLKNFRRNRANIKHHGNLALGAAGLTPLGSMEDAIVDRSRDPRPYPEDLEKFGGFLGDINFSTQPPHRKSDRILNPSNYPSTMDVQSMNPFASTSDRNYLDGLSHGSATDHNEYFYPSSPFGPASNEVEFQHTALHQPGYYDNQNSHDLRDYPSSSNYYHDSSSSNSHHPDSYGHSDNNQGHGHYYENSGSYNNPYKSQQDYSQNYGQFNHPFETEESQIHAFGGGDWSSWTSNYFVLGGLIALSAFSAFLLPSLLSGMGRRGKHRNDLDDQQEYIDENTSTSPVTAATNTGNNDDPTADSDLWTEIKGVYNDIVKIVRGDYGGIVDKLSGSATGDDGDDDKNNGPNIVYRDEIQEDDYDDDEEDDYHSNKWNRRNRRKKHRRRNNKNKYEFSDRLGVKYIDSNGDIEPQDDENYEDDYYDEEGNSTLEPTITWRSAERRSRKEQEEKKGGRTKEFKNRLNYVVKRGGEAEVTPRAASTTFNDTMASFYLGPSSSTTMRGLPFSVYNANVTGSPTGGFMGEWAKVQLIGS